MVNVPKPGDFSLGSPESRVAARIAAQRRSAAKNVLRVVVEHIGPPAHTLPADSRYECEKCVVEILHRRAQSAPLPLSAE
jgi:hypothetical protein